MLRLKFQHNRPTTMDSVKSNLPHWAAVGAEVRVKRTQWKDSDEGVHLSLAHRFGVEPFTLEDVRKVEAILADHTGWEECALYPILANMTTPDPKKWRDISP